MACQRISLARLPCVPIFTSHQSGDRNETRIDRRRHSCRGSFRNTGTRASGDRRPRLLRAVLPERKLPEPGARQSVYGWRLLSKHLAERLRVGGTSLAPSPCEAPPITEEDAAQRPLSAAKRTGMKY